MSTAHSYGCLPRVICVSSPWNDHVSMEALESCSDGHNDLSRRDQAHALFFVLLTVPTLGGSPSSICE